jgi:hypothetical protein
VLAVQESLGRQLAVRVDDEAAGDAEVGGQYPGRWEAGRRCQASGPDAFAQTIGELAVQWLWRRPVEFDQQLRALKWYPKSSSKWCLS